MNQSSKHVYPESLHPTVRKAQRLEIISIGYLIIVVIIVYLAMGTSQAMKTAWVEDILSIIPPVVFLISHRVMLRERDERFPYGYFRAVSIAFLCAALTLFAVGVWLFIDGGLKLLQAERPSIGAVSVFGQLIWHGWLMIGALLLSGIPPVFLGRMKVKLAFEIHDKALYTDGVLNKADWMSTAAAIAGIIGIYFGLWWADAVAAMIISLDIIHDGFGNLKQVIIDLMDQMPTRVDDAGYEKLPARLHDRLLALPWVEDARVRMREHGNLIFGEIFIVPREQKKLVERFAEVRAMARKMDWRLRDVVVTAVDRIARPQEE